MHVIKGRNVNDIYAKGLTHLNDYGERSDSRNGGVIVTPYPVCSVYEYPQEKVLFEVGRDANPFFHLMESLWMLAGRDDAAFLDRYVSDFGSRYAEADGHLHGAYGRRWRASYPIYDKDNTIIGYMNQLRIIVKMLRENLHDRRAVIQMWDAKEDLGYNARDIPCNTHIYPRVVNGKLDISVECRSNDIVWGAYGANAVHFAFLQEYLAAGIGVGIGKMYQFSNNFHGYLSVVQKLKLHNSSVDPYATGAVSPQPLVDNFGLFDIEVVAFVENPSTMNNYTNSFLAETAVPMAAAHAAWKEKDRNRAADMMQKVKATDWRRAGEEWFLRRVKS